MLMRYMINTQAEISMVYIPVLTHTIIRLTLWCIILFVPVSTYYMLTSSRLILKQYRALSDGVTACMHIHTKIHTERRHTRSYHVKPNPYRIDVGQTLASHVDKLRPL